MKKILFIVSLCSLLGMAPAHAANDETAAVADAAERLRVQMVEPDKARLGALVASELSYGHSGGKIDTRGSFIDDSMTGVSDFLSITTTDQTVVVGDTALVRHTLAGETHDKGKDPGTVGLKIVQVWKKLDGQWKLLARQAVRIAQ